MRAIRGCSPSSGSSERTHCSWSGKCAADVTVAATRRRFAGACFPSGRGTSDPRPSSPRVAAAPRRGTATRGPAHDPRRSAHARAGQGRPDAALAILFSYLLVLFPFPPSFDSTFSTTVLFRFVDVKPNPNTTSIDAPLFTDTSPFAIREARFRHQRL